MVTLLRRWLRRPPVGACSFCGKPPATVGPLVYGAGPGRVARAAICAPCVSVATTILAEGDRPRPTP